MATVLTGAQIPMAVMLVQRGALHLEIGGIKRRGSSVYSIIKKQYALSGTKQSVLAQFEDLIEQNYGPLAHRYTQHKEGKAVDELVIFRKWRGKNGSVFALFPNIDEGRGLCLSFEHVGQHSAADYISCVNLSIPATPEEFADLKRELESPPYEYQLKVVRKRMALKGSR